MALRYIGALPDDQWQQLLSHYLGVADAWAVHVPDGDGPLSNGRRAFADLPEVTSTSWSGMRGAVRLTGALTADARAAFRAAETSLITLDPQRKLWDYRLIRGEEVVLQVGDFTDLLIDEPDAEVLQRLGVHGDDPSQQQRLR